MYWLSDQDQSSKGIFKPYRIQTQISLRKYVSCSKSRDSIHTTTMHPYLNFIIFLGFCASEPMRTASSVYTQNIHIQHRIQLKLSFNYVSGVLLITAIKIMIKHVKKLIRKQLHGGNWESLRFSRNFVLYGTQTFIILFTSGSHRIISWASWIQSALPYLFL